MNLITEQLSYFLRILLSCVCGGVIGIERQQRTKVAGTRTHMMIALDDDHFKIWFSGCD